MSKAKLKEELIRLEKLLETVEDGLKSDVLKAAIKRLEARIANKGWSTFWKVFSAVSAIVTLIGTIIGIMMAVL